MDKTNGKRDDDFWITFVVGFAISLLVFMAVTMSVAITDVEIPNMNPMMRFCLVGSCLYSLMYFRINNSSLLIVNTSHGILKYVYINTNNSIKNIRIGGIHMSEGRLGEPGDGESGVK